ncbi:FkbM family methyltransferase [Cellvibrio sp. NN19]|uniref:FkbM family methyltransferase n=1 Tax=Cellvibrio chitinivorans TaxID=3102792 RepID=UPI002B40DE30|nr:FkbM family methyltransferase [Cellvibrio sp. NN19]
MADSIFKSKWFSEFSMRALKSAIHDSAENAIALEGPLMSELVLQLLSMQKNKTLFNEGLYKFYSFCQPKLFLSHSQILQDLWVLYMLKEKENGYFVEFGACDGLSMSNTLLLEQRYNWKGILAEPNPIWHEQLLKSRKASICKKCVSSSSGEIISFLSTPNEPELSRIEKIIPNDIHEKNGNRDLTDRIDVETISLNDLLDQYNAPSYIDYLSIDTEGSELEILKSFDFSRHQIQLISIEHAGDTEKRVEIKNILEGNGYTRWRPELSRWDDWFFKQK